MAALAELLGPATVGRLAALKADLRVRQEQDRERAAAAPVRAVCKSCGQRLPAPAAVFREAG